MSNSTSERFKMLKYPEIVITKPDRYLSRLMLVEYAGCESELTAISRYLYQSVLIRDINPKISEILENIAVNEIEHFKILGKIISKLGEKPSINLNGINDKRLEKTKKIPYKHLISENILKEQKSVENYKRLINNINNDSIVKSVKIIMDEEREHIKILEELYKSDCCPG